MTQLHLVRWPAIPLQLIDKLIVTGKLHGISNGGDGEIMIRLGIDTGGTFTDVVRLDHQGITVLKVRSTPSDPAGAILAALSELVDNDTEADIVHGSTVATNALLERKGARL